MSVRARSLLMGLTPALLAAFAACGPPPRPEPITESDLRNLNEGRAIELILGVLDRRGVDYTRGWEVDIGAEQALMADVRLGGTSYGIEWVSPQDREDYGNAIPEPDPKGQLEILQAVGDDDSAPRILVLDVQSYRYAEKREHVQRGAPGVREVEGALQRDVRDFLEHCRGRGAL